MCITNNYSASTVLFLTKAFEIGNHPAAQQRNGIFQSYRLDFGKHWNNSTEQFKESNTWRCSQQVSVM